MKIMLRSVEVYSDCIVEDRMLNDNRIEGEAVQYFFDPRWFRELYLKSNEVALDASYLSFFNFMFSTFKESKIIQKAWERYN